MRNMFPIFSKKILYKNFNKELNCKIKRGCSEYYPKFPNYNKLDKNAMIYDEKKKEQYVFTGRDGISAIGQRPAQKWVKDLCTKFNILIDYQTSSSTLDLHF